MQASAYILTQKVPDSDRDRILDAVPAWPQTTTPKRIADTQGLNTNTVQVTLRRLVADSSTLVRAVKRGIYTQAPATTRFEDSPAGVSEADIVYDANGGRHPEDAEPEMDIVTYSAGGGTRRVKRIVRSRIEVETSTGYRADSLVPIFVEGDSMWPLILPNSFALALPMARFDGPGVYAFEISGHRLVKHVDVLLGGVLRVSARNREAYPEPEEFIPVPEADTENTYRSRTTGQTGVVSVTGRLVAFTQVT